MSKIKETINHEKMYKTVCLYLLSEEVDRVFYHINKSCSLGETWLVYLPDYVARVIFGSSHWCNIPLSVLQEFVNERSMPASS